MNTALTPEMIEEMLERIDELSAEELGELTLELDTLDRHERGQRCQQNFLAFCAQVYPGFKEGAHHRHIAPMLQDMAVDDPAHWEGSEMPPYAKRLTVSMPPRFGKSATIAFLYVAWYLGHNPTHQIMMVTHTASLSEGFGRQIRDLIDSPVYQEIFPETKVSKDKSAAGDWTTTLGGKYLAVGVGANVAGHGAHLLIADDLVSEQAVLANPDTAFETAWTYMQVGPLQRLMPGGRIIMIGTRWGKKDPIGRALDWARKNTESTPWYEVRFPAVMDVVREEQTVQVSLWPEQWPLEQLLAKKAGMRPQFWAAQYMQEPTGEEGAIMKREWWRIWPHDDPPEVEFVIQTWDTAHDTKTHNDYSACLTWGVWFNEESNRHEIILLDAWWKRVEFPDLKKKALEMAAQWRPEALVVEKKAAGAPLIQELRHMGLHVEEVSPSRGTLKISNDKRARFNAVTGIVQDGLVWAPDTRWAHEIIDLCAEFPNGEFDDPVDCLVAGTQILMADGTQQRIESVQEGDFVQTPLGPRRVTAAVCTGVHPTHLLRVGGVVLEGTANHPVATTRGWVPLAEVCASDTIKTLSKKEHPWHVVKQLFFRARGTTATLTHPTKRTEGISVVEAAKVCCIELFGRLRTALFQTASMFTTRTATVETTLCQTSNSSPEKNINDCMQKKTAGSVLMHNESIWPALTHWQQPGTPARKAAPGMLPTRRSILKKAARRMLRWPGPGKSAGKTRTVWRVLFAAVLSPASWLQPGFVASRATVVTTAPTHVRRPVYNLSVEDAQCFYANGVLTHNCVELALQRFRRGGFVTLSTDEVDNDEPALPGRTAYY